ncbi:MAG: hypothetical protein ACYS0C_01455 [Planctomycetota bacterium]|jgi:hypothetical protein
MFEEKFCEECRQKHGCREVYRHLGKAKGPSVVFKVVVAFLLPLVVFIAALAVSEKILAGIINTAALRTVLSFLLALGGTFIVVGCSLLVRRKIKN